jgi:hypothetical protein
MAASIAYKKDQAALVNCAGFFDIYFAVVALAAYCHQWRNCYMVKHRLSSIQLVAQGRRLPAALGSARI